MNVLGESGACFSLEGRSIYALGPSDDTLVFVSSPSL